MTLGLLCTERKIHGDEIKMTGIYVSSKKHMIYLQDSAVDQGPPPKLKRPKLYFRVTVSTCYC